MTRLAALGGKIDEEGGLKFLQHLFREGYSQGLAVSQRGAGANMSVDISAGGAMTVTSSGIPHYSWSTATENVTVGTANATNPRKDIVVMYLDLALITDTTTNNVGATKFMVVAGTAAASPTDPADATIQTAVGAGNPFRKLARVDVAALATTVVNANITDLRVPMALATPYLYGGASNTKGHLVPNSADGTVVVSTTGSVETSTLATGAVTPAKATNPYKFRATHAGYTYTGSGAMQLVPYNVETFDSNNNFDISTNPGRYTAPVNGFYHFTAGVTFSSGGVLTGRMALYRNGSFYVSGLDSTPLSSSNVGINVTDLIQLTAGDYVEVWALASSNTGVIAAHFSGFLVSVT